MKKLQVLFRGVNLSAASLWFSCKSSFLLLWAQQLAHSSLILLDFTKPGGFIYHISPCQPSPSLSLTLSFIFLIFNNSLSALWPLIKMNSACCRLLPSRLSLCLCLWLAVVSLLCTVLTLFLKIFPSPPRLHLPWCPPHPSVHRLPPGLPSARSSWLPLRSLSLFAFNFSPPDTTVHHVPGSGHWPPSDALIHQDFEKQKSLFSLLRWPLPLIGNV